VAAIDARSAKERLHAPGEIACLDVREHGQYGEGHPFLAVPSPYSRLEVTVAPLVPRASVPILLVDEGDGVAERSAARLAQMGYRHVDWIEGGAPAWKAAGFTLFKGVNVPSKTLGELVEENWHVPMIGPDMLEAWRQADQRVHVFDGRPGAEYAKMTIPGARCMPNGELAHRWQKVIGEDTTPVVVNCAGRTRSIIGAASLKLIDSRNVFALENGTQGWAISGRTLRFGARPEALPPANRSASSRRAEDFARTHGIPRIDPTTALALACDRERSTYLFDVRDPAEHARAPHPCARSAPGGQLVQATDQWIGVRRARVILADDTGLRGSLAAFWLRQLGYEVYVLLNLPDLPDDWRLANPDPPRRPDLASIEPIGAVEAVARARRGDAFLDLRPSMEYRAAHLEGARWTTRARLPTVKNNRAVLLAGDAHIAALAARDLREAGVGDLRLVQGSERDWRAAGLALLETPQEPPDHDVIDYLFFVHDRHDGNLEAARQYLAWETGLTAQLDREERGEYRMDAIDFSRSP
jgi:rhodanese-related sulfurtransferase